MRNNAVSKKVLPLPVQPKALLLIVATIIFIAAVVAAQTTAYTIYIIGDSTVCNYAESKYPWAGWGQVFAPFFTTGSVTVKNQAIGGRSSKSFYVEGRWTEQVYNVLKKGDFVLIQFGHNDRDYTKEERYADTTTYKDYLRRYVRESREKGAIPVFVTPMNMNTWNGTALREVFTEREKGADYRGAMINVSKELTVPLIDLEKKSATFMKSVGKNYCTAFHFMGLQPGEYPNYPDGYTDFTHFQEMGSLINARMVAEGIKELAANPDVGKLAAVLAPCYHVTVSPNKTATGLVTVSGDFPEGVTVTVKVIPNANETFMNWADAAVKNVSTQKGYSFTMKNTPVTIHALFKGGTTVDATSGTPATRATALSPTLSVQTQKNQITIASPQGILAITLYNLTGRLVYANRFTSNPSVTLPASVVGSGLYTAEVTTSGGIIRRLVPVP